VRKVPTSPEIPASTIPWNIWSDSLSRQRNNYIHALMNHCLDSNKHDTDDRHDSFWLFNVRWNDGCQSLLLSHEPYMACLWLVFLASHQLFNRSNVISCACSAWSPSASNSFCRPIYGPAYQFLQASSQVLCVSNFSVEILAVTFVNCNLLAALNS